MSSFWAWQSQLEEIRRHKWILTKKMTKDQRRWAKVRVAEEIVKYCRAVDGK